MRAAACALGLAVVLGFGSCGNGAGKPTGQIVLQASGDVTPASLDVSTGVMRKRLEKLGIPAEVSAKGTRVIIRLPQENIGTARRVLPVGGALELFDLQGDLVGRSLDETGFPRALTKPPAVRSNTVLVTCKKEERYCPGVPEKPSRTYYYLFRYDPENKTHPIPEMTGADFDLKGTRQDFGMQGPESGQPIVLMQFTTEGARKFEEITRRLVERGRVVHDRIGGDDLNAFQQFAIVLDRELKSAPSVSYIDNPNGIPGVNGAEISGIGSLQEAKDLALVLQTGSLPIHFRVVSVSR